MLETCSLQREIIWTRTRKLRKPCGLLRPWFSYMQNEVINQTMLRYLSAPTLHVSLSKFGPKLPLWRTGPFIIPACQMSWPIAYRLQV